MENIHANQENKLEISIPYKVVSILSLRLMNSTPFVLYKAIKSNEVNRKITLNEVEKGVQININAEIYSNN